MMWEMCLSTSDICSNYSVIKIQMDSAIQIWTLAIMDPTVQWRESGVCVCVHDHIDKNTCVDKWPHLWSNSWQTTTNLL